MDFKKIKAALFCACIMLHYASLNAQFTDAILPTYTLAGFNVNSSVIGNDIQDVNGTTYEVALSDDPLSGNLIFGWKAGTASGGTFIGSGSGIGSLNSDVCLVKNGSNQVFALVAYEDINSLQIEMQIFIWNPTAQSFLLSQTLPVALGLVENRLKIASDDNGFFAIVWDEPGLQIRMASGLASGSGLPQFFPGSPYLLDQGSFPDVCVFRSGITTDRQIKVVYLDPFDDLIGTAYNFSSIQNGLVSPNLFFRSGNPDLQYKNPSIACPGTFGKAQDFTIVVEDTDGNSTWYIKAFNSNTSSVNGVTPYVYNNGTTGNSPWNTTSIPNTNPVVAYDNAGDAIWVSWNMDNSFGLLSAPGASFGVFPIALCTNKRANINSHSKYLYVANSATFGSNFSNVSVAGQKSSKAMFTFCDQNTSQLISKTVTNAFNVPSLRQSNNIQELSEWLSSSFQESGNYPRCSLRIIDMSGKVISEEVLQQEEIIMRVEMFCKQETPGLYILNIQSEDSHKSFSCKLPVFDKQ